MNKNKFHNIKDSGFKTPDNYFDGLEDSIMNQIKLQDKITDSGFKTPDNYFESLDTIILNKVEHKPKVISIFSKRNIFYASSIAAALILMFSIFINNDEISFDNLDVVSIENYLSEEDISTFEFASLLDVADINSDNFIESELSEELLEDYLLENASIEELIIE